MNKSQIKTALDYLNPNIQIFILILTAKNKTLMTWEKIYLLMMIYLTTQRKKM
jgi:hypothetical protein